MEIIQLLLEHGADARIENRYKETAAMAARAGKQEEAARLIERFSRDR